MTEQHTDLDELHARRDQEARRAVPQVVKPHPRQASGRKDRPRLGADVAAVHHLAVLRTAERDRLVQLTDVAALERAIRVRRTRA